MIVEHYAILLFFNPVVYNEQELGHFIGILNTKTIISAIYKYP